MHLTRYLVGIVVVLLGLCSATAHAQLDVVDAFPQLSFENPVDIQHAGDGSDRLFVVERAGVIRVFENDPEATAATPFLDIRDRVNAGGEQGLLGLAFHPAYATNGVFYVYYSASSPRRSVLARYQVDPDDPSSADAGSEEVILEVEQPYSNHNGGQIRFGPAGYLYIALGDGGSGGDPLEHGQNRATLLGSILRIDVDNPAGDRNYGIPPDNPFVGAQCGPAGCREEIYAYGLRNPWRFSFDAATGDLWAADVGQGAWEEIDVIEAGGNYGWNTMEGFHCFDPPSGCDQDGLLLPVWEYGRGEGQSVTGGFVYRGPDVPDLTGRYIYADFGSGRIWALTPGEEPENTELFNTDLNITTFGVDEADEVYFAAFDGHLYRFESMQGTAVEDDHPSIDAPELHPNHPNPFRTTTTITYTLPRRAQVALAVYDVRGRLVHTLASGSQPAGRHAATWDGRDAQGTPLAAGVYLYQLRIDGAVAASRRMIRVP